MIRKALKVGLFSVGGLMALGLFFGRDAISYFRTTAGYVSDSVRETIPIEFQIDRARIWSRILSRRYEKTCTLLPRKRWKSKNSISRSGRRKPV